MSAALVRSKPSRLVPLAIAGACLLAVAIALYAQHRMGMRPCPWCILQRVVFLVIAGVALVTALVPWRSLRIALNAITVALATGGVIAAIYQHEVAAKSYSCNLTFADKVITALGLESAWPWMFQVTAACSEAVADLFGVPFEFWSLGLFAVIALAGASLVLRAVRVEAG